MQSEGNLKEIDDNLESNFGEIFHTCRKNCVILEINTIEVIDFMKNKIGMTALALFLGMSCLSGCGTSDERIDKSAQIGKPTIICTVFPEYDWICKILGEKKEDYEVKLLLDSGVDIHSYQPTAKDIAEISDCDLFVYTGGVSESWIEETLESALNEQMQVIELMEVLGERVKTEEIVEGMEHDHTEESYDEHVWLSLKNAKILVKSLEQALNSLDEKNAAVFQENADAYIAQLEELDGEYQTVVDAAVNHTVLFGDRFPFRYLTDDYGLEYYAAFTGCSAETEASFETVTFLAGKLEEMDLSAVLVIENSDQKLAETIINSTKERDAEILVMNSLQSVKREDIEEGVSYLSIMEENLEVLKAALG